MPGFDMDRFLAIPRLSGLRCSPDGHRLVISVGRPDPEGQRFSTSLWEIDPGGERPPARLTRSCPGEGSANFTRTGDILFTSSRPDPELTAERREGLGEVAALWLLPGQGGEARVMAAPQGGVDEVRAARAADIVAFTALVHPGTASLAEDEEREKARRKAGVSARLFESFPIRLWDHYLGPRERHLFAAPMTSGPDGRPDEPVDLTPDAGHALREVDFDITPDGSMVVTGWHRADELPRPAVDLVAIDRASGERRTLASTDGTHAAVVVSPDGRQVACIRTTNGTPERAERPSLWSVDLASGAGRALAEDLEDLWPHELAWSPDSSSVLGTADLHGSVVCFRLPREGGPVEIVAADGAFADLAPAPDGSAIYALRSRLDQPPRPVRIDAEGVTPLPFPGLAAEELELPGTPERLVASAADGTPVESWLLLPAGSGPESPAPLVLFIHGGPVASWSGWHWRWNPQLLAAQGYAVLLPDPALSTGYGQAFVDRGWGRWGDEPYTDLLSALEAALGRPDLDATRTAAMGGSFGGYMANWVAGHSDRFRAIVTHASLWELRGFHGTTDDGPWWETEFGDPYLDPSRYEAHSPHRFVAQVRTPMLVIHGELDHRVPISEALRLWTDLARHGVPARFLYFPDENHWVLKPQNTRLWYATVLAFLDHHVLGRPWQRPELV